MSGAEDTAAALKVADGGQGRMAGMAWREGKCVGLL
jgi:hypothetical protein